jgi:pyruvate/2-oxoglutarate dehydrogenase complex dihydrolipoamide dehydrogenase (E3) component
MVHKPKTFDRNLIVIGGGSAGLVSALIAAAVNAKVTLIEKHKMGGDCLNTGCVPSKAFIKSAKVASLIKRSREFGINVAESHIDFAAVMERVQSIIARIEPHDSVERFQGLGVECLNGEARIISPWTVAINGQTLSTRNIIVATGARPFVPPIKNIDQIKYHVSWHGKMMISQR